MTALAAPGAARSPSVADQREQRTVQGRAAARARWRARTEPFLVFLLTAVALTVLGLRTTVHLHLVYPGAVTRLVHAYIAWWNHPPRFRSIGFTYPPLQSVVLLPFALLRPLATSLVALPVFSALCAGALLATLDRTLRVLDLDWWLRLPLLVGFALNPLFLDYGANGMATLLVMALLAAGLHNFSVWYVTGTESVRSLGFCGSWLAVAFLARYETVLWLGVIVVAVALVRLRRGATVVEVLALEAILIAPFVYTFLIWSGVSSLVGGGGFLSWISRQGAEHLNGLNFAGRVGFGARASGIVDTVWHTSPLLFVIPALLLLVAVAARRPILLAVGAMVLVGAAVSVVRMWLKPNAELLQPQYQMLALVPMLVAGGWLIAELPRHRPGSPLPAGRIVVGLVVLAGLAGSLVTAYAGMKQDHDSYDRAFTYALSSHLRRITPATGSTSPDSPADLHADIESLSTFMQAAVYAPKTVLVDELALPGLILSADSTVPYRTLAENGTAFWQRLLRHPRASAARIQYLIVANPKVRLPGYPRDLVSERYPSAYSGGLPHSEVIFRDPLVAVVQLLSLHPRATGNGLPKGYAQALQLFQRLPSLTPRKPGT